MLSLTAGLLSLLIGVLPAITSLSFRRVYWGEVDMKERFKKNAQCPRDSSLAEWIDHDDRPWTQDMHPCVLNRGFCDVYFFFPYKLCLLLPLVFPPFSNIAAMGWN